jgi:signal transduction histidine kinase
VQQGRPLDLGRKNFVEYVGDLTADFERETGISVNFIFDGGQIAPPASVAGELVRIVQEALMNVRKHSGAKNVTIGFTVFHGRWILRIDDDGRGFDFDGRRGMTELEEQSQGPYVIRERVSTLGGELEIESRPGRGARLEIAFPKDALG